MNALIETVAGLQGVLGICPCCGEIFRLIEGKFVFPQRQPKTCDYLELVASEKRLSAAEERLQAARDRFDQKLQEQSARLAGQGRRLAKRRLKKIDPTFSGEDVDPQGVKAIFHPVEYIIFHGLGSYAGVDVIEFVSRSPSHKTQEALVRSIDNVVRAGDVEFEILRMRDDGSFEVERD